ncbi:MAG: cytochrome b, partial [Burkholderiales bacterium]
TVKDMVGVVVFLIAFSIIVFFIPEMGGYFLEHNNFIPADILKTPEHIAPLWYFTPFYSILRANTFNFLWVPAKLWGVLFMGLAVIIFFFLPWLDRSPVKSIRYRGPIYKTALMLFTISFIVLGYLGTQPVNEIRTVIAQMGTVIYFLFFFLMPWYTKIDKTKPEPERVRW